jgi:hypothetical protein
MVIQAPLRSWLSTTVPSIRPLATSRAQNLRLLASPRSSASPGYRNIEDRVDARVAPHSDNPDGTVGLH